VRDALLTPNVEPVRRADLQGIGANKVWQPPEREGVAVAGCAVERSRAGLWSYVCRSAGCGRRHRNAAKFSGPSSKQGA
jgi:hypothetical protein